MMEAVSSKRGGMNTKTKLPEDACIVVANGGGARIFRNMASNGGASSAGKADAGIALHQVELIDPAQLPLSTPAGHQPAELTGEEVEEAGFAKRLARRLNDDALKHRYQHLVLLADAQTLGQMRPLLHKETLGRLVAEHALDLTNAPVGDIEKALR